ncbi:hypothetical protein I316_06030 [Kwoniella heveanensis BCC8398]|uniref:Uncharacterized protein n=1 Tax=Kwoniella heveanensis BCC8398 TaxID=1296120 RepID=A0A1B9GMZ1_9TREE|nr:hypothetical protein I316_06030 [Kwoniella heveanensis BCC8398]
MSARTQGAYTSEGDQPDRSGHEFSDFNTQDPTQPTKSSAKHKLVWFKQGQATAALSAAGGWSPSAEAGPSGTSSAGMAPAHLRPASAPAPEVSSAGTQPNTSGSDQDAITQVRLHSQMVYSAQRAGTGMTASASAQPTHQASSYTHSSAGVGGRGGGVDSNNGCSPYECTGCCARGKCFTIQRKDGIRHGDGDEYDDEDYEEDRDVICSPSMPLFWIPEPPRPPRRDYQ